MNQLYWVTGFPGSGKSTFAKKLSASLKKMGRQPIIIDGDEMREILGNDSLNVADRQRLSFIYANLALNMFRQGVDVIVATVSMFEAVRTHVKDAAGAKIIFLEPGLSHLKRVNRKALYDDMNTAADAYEHIYPSYELPNNPDWHIADIKSVEAVISELIEHYEREQE